VGMIERGIEGLKREEVAVRVEEEELERVSSAVGRFMRVDVRLPLSTG